MAKDKVKKPFYKKIWFWVAAIIIIAIVASGGEEEPAPTASEDSEASQSSEENGETSTEATAEETSEEEANEEEVETAKIGETATVADVSFTVNGVEETNEINSGNEFTDNATTEGKFVILDVTVENGQNESLTIDSSYFKIITGEGVEYDPSTDSDVTMAMSGEDDFFLQQVNPGLTKSGKVVFEVGADVDLSQTVLHCQTGFFGTESIEIALSE